MISSAGAYACDGSPTTLTTNANATYTYQWEKNNTIIAGATTNTYVASQLGTYKVVVGDANGCYDSPPTFTINPLPTVTITNTGICIGDTLITNTPDSTIAQIKWYKDGQLIKNKLTSYEGFGETIASSNQYNWVADVYVHDDGTIYFSEPENHRVIRYDTVTATFSIVAGGNGQGNALNQLNAPYGIHVDAAKNLFISDYNNHRVVRWAPGSTTGVIVAGNGTQGSGANQLNGPIDVTIDAQNRLYVSEHNGSRVTRWATSSTGVVVAGQGGAGSALNQLNNPYFIYLTPDNELYINDYSNHRVVRYIANAISGTLVAGGISGNNNTGLKSLNSLF